MLIGLDPTSDHVSVDFEKQLIKFTVLKKPHIPYAAFKCLVKIAYSLLPQASSTQFESTRKFLINSDFESTGGMFFPLVFSYFIDNVTDFLEASIFQRIDVKDKSIPIIIFRLFYGSHIFQTHLPNIEFDDSSSMMRILDPGVPLIGESILDLNNNQIVADAVQEQTMSFEGSSSAVPLEENRLYQSLKKFQ